MNIKQFRFDETNLAYLIYSKNEAVAVDGGAVIEILDFLDNNDLKLKYIINTHDHWDHIPGNKELSEKSGAPVLKMNDLIKKTPLLIDEEKINIMSTPGHTLDSVVIHAGNNLLTGDTLFTGTIGNCYSKEYEIYFNSLKRILSLPKKTIIWPGHDFIEYATKAILKHDPQNSIAGEKLENYKDGMEVYSTLEEELKYNLFIRFNDHDIDHIIAKTGKDDSTDYKRWRALMSLH